MTTTEHEPAKVRPFADLLRELGRGSTHEELSETIQTLVRRVADTGKKGTLTYTIEVSPMKGADETLVVSDKITTKFPEHDRPSLIYFADSDGNLQKDSPNQFSFDSLREVPAGVNATTGEIKSLPSQPTAREMGGQA